MQSKIVANWLKNYSSEVVVRVMKNYDTIINDKTTYTIYISDKSKPPMAVLRRVATLQLMRQANYYLAPRDKGRKKL